MPPEFSSYTPEEAFSFQSHVTHPENRETKETGDFFDSVLSDTEQAHQDYLKNKDWEVFKETLRELKEDEYNPEPGSETSILTSLTTLPSFIEHQRELGYVTPRLQELRQQKRDHPLTPTNQEFLTHLERQRADLTLHAVKWQQSVIRMIRDLSLTPELRTRAGQFWKLWRTISTEEADHDTAIATQSGIIGNLTLGQVLNTAGYETYLAPPPLDAHYGIDLLARPQDPSRQRDLKAIQLKTSAKGNFDITTAAPTHTIAQHRDETVNRFLTNCQELGIVLSSQVDPQWVTIHGGFGQSTDGTTVNPNTGFVRGPGLNKAAQEIAHKWR